MLSTRMIQMLQPRSMTFAMRMSQSAFMKTPARFFSKDNEEAEAAEAAEPEPTVEAAPEPEPVKATAKAKAVPKAAPAAEAPPLDRSLFQPFSVGNIK